MFHIDWCCVAPCGRHNNSYEAHRHQNGVGATQHQPGVTIPMYCLHPPFLSFSHSPLVWIDATAVVARFATILVWFGATYLPAAMMAKRESPTDKGPRFRPSGRFRALKKALLTIADPTHHASCNAISRYSPTYSKTDNEPSVGGMIMVVPFPT